MKEIEFILYVSNQSISKTFYENLFQIKPSLDIPGMTEFQLSKNVKLGLMPENGIAKILRSALPHPCEGNGIPRCELYLKVTGASNYIKRSLANGALIISELQPRDWGDTVGYIADPDGHVIAFAEKQV